MKRLFAPNAHRAPPRAATSAKDERTHLQGVLHSHLPPVVGQLASGIENSKAVLRLWSLDWVRNVNEWHEPPLLVLWLPCLLGINCGFLHLTGLETHGEPPRRRWVAQKWSCELLTASSARSFFSRPPLGVVPPTPNIPQSPVNDDAPFD
jgi:hypothetical protein